MMQKTLEDTTVLLVEDNCDDEELTRRALQKVGITRMPVARDGREAINMLLGPDQLTPLPDLILLDLRLPKLDGLAVLEQLRADERTRHLRVIVLTSSEDPRDKNVCSALAVIAFLAKPLSEKILRSYL